MNILITGVAGLLGSRLADWAVEKDDINVYGIDDLSGGFIENVHPKVNFIKIDLTDLAALKNFFKSNKIDLIYHFAAYAAEGLSPFIRKFNYENNLIASTNLITCSIQYSVKRIVFASSMSVYGNSNKAPFTESMQQAPIDPYAISKFAVEMDLKIAYEQHGLEYTIIRPHNFYGIKQNIWDKYRNVLGIWMYQLINKQNPTIFGDGEQKRAFSYVDDSIEPFWRAGISKATIGEIINLGGIKEYSINEACQILSEVTGDDFIEPIYLESRHEVKDAWSTWNKSVELLGFRHTVDLHEGLEKMWYWAQKQPQRTRFEWSEFEIDKGIYQYWKTE